MSWGRRPHDVSRRGSSRPGPACLTVLLLLATLAWPAGVRSDTPPSMDLLDVSEPGSLLDTGVAVITIPAADPANGAIEILAVYERDWVVWTRKAFRFEVDQLPGRLVLVHEQRYFYVSHYDAWHLLEFEPELRVSSTNRPYTDAYMLATTPGEFAAHLAATGWWPKDGPPDQRLTEAMIALIEAGQACLAWEFFMKAWPAGRAGRDAFLSEFRTTIVNSEAWPTIMAVNDGMWTNGCPDTVTVPSDDNLPD